MAYTPFNNAGPLPEHTVGQMLSAIKLEVQVIRDILAALGYVQGFNYSHSGGTTKYPTDMLYTRGSEIIKVVNTYITTGLGNYVPSRKKFYYSSDTGSNYYEIRDESNNFIMDITYNSDDTVIATTWGAV